MIYVECKPDGVLVRTLTRRPQKQVVHEIKGKFGVIGRLNRSINSRGLVDEDPHSTQPTYLTRMTVRLNLQDVGLRLMEDRDRENLVTILCPRLEEWVVDTAKAAGIRLRDYNLPDDAVKLHGVINVDLRKFERLATDLRPSNRFRQLRRLLRL